MWYYYFVFNGGVFDYLVEIFYVVYCFLFKIDDDWNGVFRIFGDLFVIYCVVCYWFGYDV